MQKVTEYKIRKILMLIASLLLTFNVAFGQRYPEISELKSSNFLFAQFQEEVVQANMNNSRGKQNTVNFYTYVPKSGENIFTIASRCCVLYDTIATVNRIEESIQDVSGKKLYLPSAQGLFIPEHPESNLEIILYKEFQEEILSKKLPIYTINGQKFFFLQATRFTPAQRAFFVNTGMTLPLDESIITSTFGMRISPISGKWKFHNGIDMAAPIGTPVYACKNATVKSIGLMDPTYGNYIILQHTNGMTSLYAHLDEILAVKGQEIKTGHIIGKVGTTGASTGPHLHFEIRINGQATDPESIIQ